jgi:hypothetical protein
MHPWILSSTLDSCHCDYKQLPLTGAVLVFRQKFEAPPAIASHSCWFEASMRGDVISSVAEFMVNAAGLKATCL